MSVIPLNLEAPTRYLKLRGTLKQSDFTAFMKLMKEGVEKGKAPLYFKERRFYFYEKTGRQVDILQFADRRTSVVRQYSIRYRGMTSTRKDNLRSGVGGEYACSEQGAGLLKEIGMIPIKEKVTTGYQWTIGNNIYLVIYEVNGLTKGKTKVEVKGKPFMWEIIAFCDPMMEEEVSRVMQMHLELLQPYLKVIEKKNRGC